MGRAETTTYWNAHALGASVCFFGKVFGGALRGGACCRFVEAQECSGEVRPSECPNGHRIPARGETPGMPHNRSVLKERRIHPGCSDLFYGGRVPGLALGISASTGASRAWVCARRERGDRLGVRAVARGGSGCRRSYARSGPGPLPLRGLGLCPSMGWFDCRQ